MKAAQLQSEALHRARDGMAESNLPAIYAGFEAMGISDIQPRVNILTYHAWRALGHQVKKGEHGVKITTWIPYKDKKTGEDKRRPKACTVFHISQTDPAIVNA